METHSAIRAVRFPLAVRPTFRIAFRREFQVVGSIKMRRSKMRLRLFALVVAGTTLAITPVQAQTRIDFTPHIGMYFPFNAAVNEASQGLEMRQVSAVVLGGRVAFHAARHFLIETTIDYTPSPTAVSFNNTVLDSDGGLVLASARGVYRLGRLKPKTPELQLSAGVGLVTRFGKAWTDRTGTTDPAAVIGLAGR